MYSGSSQKNGIYKQTVDKKTIILTITIKVTGPVNAQIAPVSLFNQHLNESVLVNNKVS